jgi:hypothetical protein
MTRALSFATAIIATALSTACVAGGGHGLDLHVLAALSNAQEARGASAQAQSESQWSSAHSLSEPMALRDALALLAGDKARVGPDIKRVDIDLGPGTYRLAAPLVLTLGPGWRGTPITLHGSHDAHVVISGAKPLQTLEPVRDPAVLARLPAAARSAVRVVDLAKNGVPAPAPFAPIGFALPVQAVPLELFYRDQPLTLARWPKQGFATIASTPDGPQGARFTLAGADLAGWRGDPGLRAMGYWARDWADETLAVTAVDPAHGVLTLERPPRFGMKAGQRVFIENALSALDGPGQYYVDLQANRVYVWPPGPTGNGELEVSVADSLLRMNNATAVSISDVTFDMSRGDAVTLQGGSDLSLQHVGLLNAGARALVSSATNSRFAGLTVERSGAGGIVVNAGDRNRLTSGNVVVANSGFSDYARLARAYRPAISLSGVGDRIEGNVIHNGPHAAIIFSGNDHRIIGNKIYDVVQETSDAGAIYTGRDWTARGTVIENNFLHDIGTPERPQATKGIYLDDQASGITIRRNVFARVNQAVFIGGGRDDVVEQNLFVHCTPAIYIDSRGLSWQRPMVVDPHSTLRAQLSDRHVDAPPYSTRYPSLARLMSDVPGAPKGTVIANNAVVDGEALEIDNGARPYVDVRQTFGSAEVRFAQPMSNSARHSLATLKLAPDSPALSRGFAPSAVIAPTRSGQ